MLLTQPARRRIRQLRIASFTTRLYPPTDGYKYAFSLQRYGAFPFTMTSSVGSVLADATAKHAVVEQDVVGSDFQPE